MVHLESAGTFVPGGSHQQIPGTLTPHSARARAPIGVRESKVVSAAWVLPSREWSALDFHAGPASSLRLSTSSRVVAGGVGPVRTSLRPLRRWGCANLPPRHRR